MRSSQRTRRKNKKKEIEYRITGNDSERSCAPKVLMRFLSRVSGFQCPVKERQAHVHPVIDVGVVVVEFLASVPDAGLGEPLRQDARAVMDVILVAPTAIDVDAAQRLQVVAVFRDEIDR